MKLSQTSRLLALFHLFLHSEEMEIKYIQQFFEEVAEFVPNRKMIARDMKFLKDAGLVDYRYSRDKDIRAYLPAKDKTKFVIIKEPLTVKQLWADYDSETDGDNLPEAAYHRSNKYVERIVWLCYMIAFMYGDPDPYKWYHDHFDDPFICEEQMWDDLRELQYVGYGFRYVQSYGEEEGCYEWENIYDAYSLFFTENKELNDNVCENPPCKRTNRRKSD